MYDIQCLRASHLKSERNLAQLFSRVVFTREKFLHFICSLPHGNHSDSNNPLTKMHTLAHIGHLKYNIRNSMNIHFRIQCNVSGYYVCNESAKFS